MIFQLAVAARGLHFTEYPLLDGVYYIRLKSGENCLLSDKFVKITSK